MHSKPGGHTEIPERISCCPRAKLNGRENGSAGIVATCGPGKGRRVRLERTKGNTLGNFTAARFCERQVAAKLLGHGVRRSKIRRTASAVYDVGPKGTKLMED